MIQSCFFLFCALAIGADGMYGRQRGMVDSIDNIVSGQPGVKRLSGAHDPNQMVIDSLERAMAGNTANDRLKCMLELAIEHVDQNNEKALAIMVHAERLAVYLGDSMFIAQCLRIKGQVLLRLQRSEEAMDMLQSSLGISERQKFTSERLRALIPYGVGCIERSEYDKGLRGLTLAHELAVTLSDTAYIEAALNNLGVVYYKLKDYSKALHYWKASVESKARRNTPSFREHVNMSLAYANLGDFRNARQALNDCESICKDGCSEEALIHLNYASGFIFLGLKDYKNAERSLVRSYRLSERNGKGRMLLDNVYLLADVYQKQQRTDLALSYLKKGEEIINRGVEFNLEIIKIYQRFADVYLDLEDFKRAALYQSQYIRLKDSIYSEDLTTSLMRAEANYLERLNKAQIASQKEVILLNEEIIQRQRTLNVLTIFLAILVLACCIFLYRSYKLKQLMNLLLEERIRERTHELERSRNELLTALREQKLVLHRAEREAVEMINTIHGLCLTAKEEENYLTTYSYLEKIERSCGQLRQFLPDLFCSHQPCCGSGCAGE